MKNLEKLNIFLVTRQALLLATSWNSKSSLLVMYLMVPDQSHLQMKYKNLMSISLMELSKEIFKKAMRIGMILLKL